jgi:SAM-dependent methyltransferase|tara:strand:+ start:1108 stop:1911 length:804 start_codon:yes stop_codon:yes gene_type:complete
MNEYLKGDKLYGDNFSIEEINEWFDKEAEGYADKVRDRNKNKGYRYSYHALNKLAGFNFLRSDHTFNNVLGMGSAFGDEFIPIESKIGHLTIIEPSDLFSTKEVLSIPIDYVKPEISGSLPFKNNSFDLILCLSTLHHIPNVSFVLGEMTRCLKPGGYMLIRDPLCSQGDWEKPRKYLTKNERGIPLKIFRNIISDNKLNIVNEKIYVFRPLIKIWEKFSDTPIFNSTLGVKIDGFFSSLFKWNYRYHPDRLYERFTPVAVYYVLKK